MRTRSLLPALMLIVALATATALWAQEAPTTSGKTAHKQCAMHAQGTAIDCCLQGQPCCEDARCTDGQCMPGARTSCGKDMACCKDQQCCAKQVGQCADGQCCKEDACCKDGQCQDCAQGCCTQTAEGMQCTMAGHAGHKHCKTHGQQMQGAAVKHSHRQQ
ncbi:MAG: hypothetical protein BWY76_00839 [bacterium ADurb.Bin429]|nr:MAG: hypothetical protein BWY76_00839 [bacterium ADurb.Bin429]